MRAAEVIPAVGIGVVDGRAVTDTIAAMATTVVTAITVITVTKVTTAIVASRPINRQRRRCCSAVSGAAIGSGICAAMR